MTGDSPVQTYTYSLDQRDRITSVSDSWLAFAQENDAPELNERTVVGREVTEFMTGTEVRQLYQLIFARVRENGVPVELPFRCDAPRCRRFMRLKIMPAEGGGLSLESALLRSEARPEVTLIDARRPRTNDLLSMCAWCKRVRVDPSEWVEVEEAVERLDLFGGDIPEITHGMCPGCLGRVQEEYGIDVA